MRCVCDLNDVSALDVYKRQRYGNAIQFWGTCSDSVIDHNWIYQVYDTAITHQYRNTDQNVVAKGMTYSNNLIEYCTFSFEYFWKCVDSSDNVITPPTFYMEDISVTNNIMRFSGYGLSLIHIFS